MRIRKTSLVLAAVLLGAAGLALAHGVESSPAPTSVAPAAPRPIETATDDGLEAVDPEAPLPPNHPPIDQAGAAASPHGHGHGGAIGEAPSAPAAITWKVDAAWKTLPNPSAMRIATNGVPRAAGDDADAELAVTRAGGDVDANVARWASQFGDATPKRRDTTVRGLKVTVVELEGRFAGGMGGASDARDGWAMLGAIVSTPGQPYFFKLTGPRATVRAARAKFDALIASVTPSST